jgi:predicted DNA-binding transcriptional regulator AlpA
MAAPPEDRLLRVEAVAEKLDVSVRHVWRLEKSGQLPQPIKLLGSTRWSERELNAWLAAGCPPRDEWNTRRTLALAPSNGARLSASRRPLENLAQR